MKKYLTAAVITVLLILGIYYGGSRYGFYVDFHPDAPVTVNFKTDDKKFLYRQSDGTWKSFVIKGVDIYSGFPGHYGTDYALEKEDYLRWMDKIGEMGANTIRVFQIMDDDFYNALYQYNMSHEKKPLYLLQGNCVEDAANYGEEDVYDDEFTGELMQTGKEMVDIIHGNRIIPLNTAGGGSGRYSRDLSKWVIGYLVGAEWSADTIAYANLQLSHSGQYKGTYFCTTEDAQPFEAVMAEVMDSITEYESKKYKQQRPVGFINDPQNDPFEYRDNFAKPIAKYQDVSASAKNYARQLKKFNQLDAEHITKTDQMKAGYYAAYRLYDFCPKFYRYLSVRQKKKIASLLKKMDKTQVYDGYLDLLGSYHSMPVIAAGFGFSSSRGSAGGVNHEPLTEQEQGQRLMEVYRDMLEAGWSGGFISGWQDQWERRSWNTSYAQEPANNVDWKDVQTDGQGYGLMEFRTAVCEIDGDKSEWSETDKVCENKNLILSAKVDGTGLCFLIEGKNLQNKVLYLPIDTTQQSGSKQCREPKLRFSRDADFLMILDGKENSRLLVQARSESVRENFLKEIDGTDPFTEYPKKDSDVFVAVNTVLDNQNLYNTEQNLKNNRKKYLYLPVRETGKLRYGNNNPQSKAYDSLADFCYGKNCVEIRIPWLLLNFGNPAKMLIHQDYYENYGVEFERIKECWMGIAFGQSGTIKMNPFKLQWKNMEYQERLKQSYDVVQSVWR